MGRSGRTWRIVAAVVVLAAILAAVALVPRWKAAIDKGAQRPVAPFRIAGNLYYVGANDVTAFLLTDPKGHVLIDGGYRGTAPMIAASIRSLGFRLRDVRLLLNTHAHPDHAGGLAALKRASGAPLWASERDADALEAGGDDPMIGVARPLVRAGLFGFPAARVDRRLRDGDRIRVGATELIALVTPGHTRGCTSWAFRVREAGRPYRVLALCGVTLSATLTPFAAEPYPGFRAEYRRTLDRLRRLPIDIWLAPHARQFGRWRKLQRRAEGGDPVAPFVDRAGYVAHIDEADRRFRAAYPAPTR